MACYNLYENRSIVKKISMAENITAMAAAAGKWRLGIIKAVTI
jgi:hypothetical protein